jgi:fucose 4-O-acetylase-like acetyltransferase
MASFTTPPVTGLPGSRSHGRHNSPRLDPSRPIPRQFYLDRIRVVLTVLVILHHTAITYGAPGGWYYTELPGRLSFTGVLFLLFVSVNQSFFMGFFFLIAGYFTPGAYARKSLRNFVGSRLLRLGVPLVAFVLLLRPLTVALADLARPDAPPAGFGTNLLAMLKAPAWNPGPLWFAQALLLFTFGYVIWRKVTDRNWHGSAAGRSAPMPSARAWQLSALFVGAGALLMRQVMPVGQDFLGMQLGFFSSYLFLFGVGTMAWQRNWFERLPWRTARAWLIVSVILSPAIVLAYWLSVRGGDPAPEFHGGFGSTAILYAFWEPFTAWGIIAAMLVWFRQHGNQPSAAWQFCSARAYTVYIVHAPVLVAISVALRAWAVPSLLKFAVTGTLACCGSLAVASLLLLIPGAKRIL